MILTYKFVETAGPVAPRQGDPMHRLKLPMGTLYRKRKPQAYRGDLCTLTAATFTVLTGFTRAGPTGLGCGNVRARQTVGQTTLPLSREGVLNMLDPAAIDAAQLDPDYVESKFLTHAGVSMNPSLRGDAEAGTLPGRHRFEGRLRTTAAGLHFYEHRRAPVQGYDVQFPAAVAPVSVQDLKAVNPEPACGYRLGPRTEPTANRNLFLRRCRRLTAHRTRLLTLFAAPGPSQSLGLLP